MSIKLLFSSLLILSLSFSSYQNDESDQDSNPVLLELFTSQGCSSCPPADQVLAKLNREAIEGKLEVVALSFHVDYWNRLGWKDPYSDAAYSERQRIYAGKLKDEYVYTPEIVINGSKGIVGSREYDVRRAIKDAAKKQKAVDFEVKQTQEEGKTASFSYRFAEVPSDYFLQIAVVDPVVENNVPRGENRGRHLTHVQVVRSFETIKNPEQSGTFEIDLSVSDQPKDVEIIVFLQHKESWEVAGVKKIRR